MNHSQTCERGMISASALKHARSPPVCLSLSASIRKIEGSLFQPSFIAKARNGVQRNSMSFLTSFCRQNGCIFYPKNLHFQCNNMNVGKTL